MIKVLLVDDEVLAMDYLQNLIAWEEHGFQIVGKARSGRSALDIFDREKPQIVISDIRMAGMDGLELTRQIRQKDAATVIVLLSAYRDFEYAQKGIEYGVTNYLLKHELSEQKLLAELGKIAEKLKGQMKEKEIYHKYFVKQLIYNDTEVLEGKEIGNRFLMVILQKNDEFVDGNFQEQSWTMGEKSLIREIMQKTDDGIKYLAEEQLAPNHLVVLYRLEGINSLCKIKSEIESVCRRTAEGLIREYDCQFNLLYSNEIDRSEISRTFRKMSYLIRYAVFWKRGIYALEKFPQPEESAVSWNEQMDELREMIYEEKEKSEEFLCSLFEMVSSPMNLTALRELVHALENMLHEVEEKESCHRKERCQIYKKDEICGYYARRIKYLAEFLQRSESGKYTRTVRDMMKYIHKNYSKEISLDTLGEEFHMNGAYLGSIFKGETGKTFLKYLTSYRVEEAERLLEEGNYNISEVSAMVGYKTSQYFSQIFVKYTGMTPQEYRKWSRGKK